MAQADLPKDIVLADTATKLGLDAPGGVIVAGSHGGRYAAYLTLKVHPRAVIHNAPWSRRLTSRAVVAALMRTPPATRG